MPENLIPKKYVHYTNLSADLNSNITEIMEDYKALVAKAKSMGLDIRLYPESTTLVLYFNDDYPDSLLVDKHVSSFRKGEEDVI